MSKMVGSYRIVRKLGEGGMAAAFLATDAVGQQVVAKVALTSSPDAMVKLRDEAQAGFRVTNPFVVRTLDFFVDRGRAVLVIEYVDGCALSDLRLRGGAPNPLPAVAVAWVGRAIASALAAIHEAEGADGQPLGMLHRDVTASNILVDREGVPRLIDLGIAHSIDNEQEKTQAGLIKGTLRFVAPELILGSGYSAATDLWALGVSLFEAAVGRQMVTGTPVQIFRALTGGTCTALRPGEFIQPALHDALLAMLCDKDDRLRNARAAARMFASVEQKLALADPEQRTGQVWLARLVPYATRNYDHLDASLPALRDDCFDGEALGTLIVPGVGRATATPNLGRIVIGDGSTGSAPTQLAMPAIEVDVSDDAAPASALTATSAPTSAPTSETVMTGRQAIEADASDNGSSVWLDAGTAGPSASSSSSSDVWGELEAPAPDPDLVAARVRALPESATVVRAKAIVARAPHRAVVVDARDPGELPADRAGASSAAPALLLPAVDVALPAAPARAAPALQLPAVLVAPASMVAAATRQMAAVDVAPAAGPTLPRDAVALDLVAIAAAAEASTGASLPGHPLPMLADVVHPAMAGRGARWPGLQRDAARAAPGDVLPAGAATLQMPAWTPPDGGAVPAAPLSPTKRDDDNEPR
ncbi:MAG: hypothetical protein FJ137_09885 [Deltaproteobacteria bacterium]|nr:hypothetical protein [Deltaproteobacteria bacterium]